MRIVQDHPRLAGAAILVASIAINAALYWMAVRNFPEDDVAKNVAEATDRPVMEKQAQIAPPSIRVEPPSSIEPAEQNHSLFDEPATVDASAGSKPPQENLFPSRSEVRQPAHAKIEKIVKPHARKIRQQVERRPSRNYLSLEALPSHKDGPSSDAENVL